MGLSAHCILLALALSGTLGAATAPPTWVRWFTDDFEDGTLRRWKFEDLATPPDARVERSGGSQVMALRGPAWAMARTAFGSDYRLKARLKLISGGLLMAVRNTCESYAANIMPNRIGLQRFACNGPATNLRAVSRTLDPDRWYVFELVAIGSEITVVVDGEALLTVTDTGTPVLYGAPAIGSVEGASVQVDDVEVTGPPRAPGDLQIVDFALPRVATGLTYEYRLTAAGGTPPYRWSIPRDAFRPPGLSLSPEGVLTGKPEFRGWFWPAMFSVADSAGNRAMEIISIGTEDEHIITPKVLPAAEMGKDYLFKLEATSPTACSWLGLNLPPGLALDARTGTLSGVPTVGGVYSFLAICLDPKRMDGPDETFTLFVADPQPSPLTIATRPGELGDISMIDDPAVTYVRAAGGVPPYSWAVTAGELPPGTRLMTRAPVRYLDGFSAAIGGRPWSAGEYRFTLEATDSLGAKASQDFSLRTSLLQVRGSGDEVGVLGVPMSLRLRAANAIGQTRWTSILLPAGLELTAEGEVKGTPTECGLLQTFFEVTDSGNPPATFRSNGKEGVPVLCRMDPLLQLDISIPQVVRAKVGQPLNLRFGIGNGTGQGYRLVIDSGSLAPGLSLAEAGVPGAYVVSGTVPEAGTFDCFLRATDSGGNFGVRRLRIVAE